MNGVTLSGRSRFQSLNTLHYTIGSPWKLNFVCTHFLPAFAQEQVLATELDIGDEIALQPGPRTLDYKGEYLPVTDMVYFAAGDGIVPVMEQVKSVLPPGSSSVKGVSVIWANSDDKDFDIALSTLEDEYFKYSTKLAVSCVVERVSRLKKNAEVDEAVPDFNPGTMAVVSGPKTFAIEAIAVLLNKGYPENCICVLPA